MSQLFWPAAFPLVMLFAFLTSVLFDLFNPVYLGVLVQTSRLLNDSPSIYSYNDYIPLTPVRGYDCQEPQEIIFRG